MEDFVSIILKHVPVKREFYERNEFLVSQGDKNQKVYLIVSGAVRIYYLSKEEEFTIRFGYKDSMISMLPTYFTGEGSLFYMQSLRKTEVIVIEKSELDKFMATKEEYVRNFNLILEDLVAQQIEREIDLLTTSPQERLFRVMHRSPQVFQEIPLKYIASYLRMTPETLSRIMKSNS